METTASMAGALTPGIGIGRVELLLMINQDMVGVTVIAMVMSQEQEGAMIDLLKTASDLEDLI